MFNNRAGRDFDPTEAGTAALTATQSFAPDIYTEMLGIAEGASVAPALIGMLNARTEILKLLRAGTRGECSVVIHVPLDATPPTAVQTWDWYCELRDSWLVWEIPLADGSTTKTMTEYGIVGKSGLNTRGLGVLFTILHHIDDGKRIGVPVHVAARWVLDNAPNIVSAAKTLSGADVSASSSINLVAYEAGVSSAMTVELHPNGPGFVVPNERGVLIHTNHFLAQGLSAFDTEPQAFPDTLSRYNLLQQEIANLATINHHSVLKVMSSHVGGEDAVCCHHNPKRAAAGQYETLSTVSLDLVNATLKVHAGGPCSHPMLL